MPFTSFNATNPRANLWNFHKNILRIDDFEKLSFFANDSPIGGSFRQKDSLLPYTMTLLKGPQRSCFANSNLDTYKAASKQDGPKKFGVPDKKAVLL